MEIQPDYTFKVLSHVMTTNEYIAQTSNIETSLLLTKESLKSMFNEYEEIQRYIKLIEEILTRIKLDMKKHNRFDDKNSSEQLNHLNKLIIEQLIKEEIECIYYGWCKLKMCDTEIILSCHTNSHDNIELSDVLKQKDIEESMKKHSNSDILGRTVKLMLSSSSDINYQQELDDIDEWVEQHLNTDIIQTLYENTFWNVEINLTMLNKYVDKIDKNLTYDKTKELSNDEFLNTIVYIYRIYSTLQRVNVSQTQQVVNSGKAIKSMSDSQFIKDIKNELNNST